MFFFSFVPVNLLLSQVVSLDNTKKWQDSVDGRNPAPVGIGSLCLRFTRFLYIPGSAGFLPSTVCSRYFGASKDVFHDFQTFTGCNIMKFIRLLQYRLLLRIVTLQIL